MVRNIEFDIRATLATVVTYSNRSVASPKGKEYGKVVRERKHESSG